MCIDDVINSLRAWWVYQGVSKFVKSANDELLDIDLKDAA